MLYYLQNVLFLVGPNLFSAFKHNYQQFHVSISGVSVCLSACPSAFCLSVLTVCLSVMAEHKPDFNRIIQLQASDMLKKDVCVEKRIPHISGIFGHPSKNMLPISE